MNNTINIIENSTKVEIPASNIIQILESSFFVTIADDNSVTVQDVVNYIKISNHIAVDVKEEIVSIVEVGIQGPEGPPGVGGTITLSGDVSGSGETSIITTLANSGVSAGKYGNSAVIPSITVDSKGRVTNISERIIAYPAKPLTTILGYGNTTSGKNIVLSAGDELRVRDSGLTIGSPTDGEMEITADTVLTLTSPTVDIGGGFRVDLPSSGSATKAFSVNIAGDPGIYFNRPGVATGEVVIRLSSTDYHSFGVLNQLAGDVTHTDGTNSMTYDASLNELALSAGVGSLRPPNMTTTQRNDLNPTEGDMIYNTTTSKHEGYDGTSWNAFY